MEITMFTVIRLVAWYINRHLYGARTAAVIWSIDTTIARVERVEGHRS
jgi:hypothetical protein